jgi:DNA-binding GntR family transcriptional regulator
MALIAALRTRDPWKASMSIEAHLTSARNRALGL